MNASDFKRKIEQKHPGSVFFSRSNMQFGGDTMRNYGVRSVQVKTADGKKDVWELYRLRPTRYGFYKSVFWDKVTLKPVHNVIKEC